MDSINDNITEDVLLNEINEILHLPMYKEKIIQEQRKMGQRNKKCIVPKYHHSNVGTEINALFWDVLIHVGCMLLLYAKSRKRMKHDGQICISVYSDHDSIIAHDRILSLWAVWCLSAFLGRVFFCSQLCYRISDTSIYIYTY